MKRELLCSDRLMKDSDVKTWALKALFLIIVFMLCCVVLQFTGWQNFYSILLILLVCAYSRTACNLNYRTMSRGSAGPI